MQLIAPLAAGIAGAADGTAEIYQRGTSTRATLYADFEGTQPVASLDGDGDPILNAYGRAVVYVNEVVRVVVKDADGATVVTFTQGEASTAVEYIGTSFTGTEYGTATTGPSYPTTVQAILDLWLQSAGAIDFQVDGGAGAINLSALAANAQLVHSVKAYGAVGDGTTNDLGAVQSAIAAADAAGGGVVFFPPGTYRVTNRIDVPYGVSLVGLGPGCTTLSLDSGTAKLIEVEGEVSTSYGYANVIRGLTLTAALVNDQAVVWLDAAGNVRLLMQDVVIGGALNTGHLLDASGTDSLVTVTDSVFVPGNGSVSAAVTSSGSYRTRIERCVFVGNATYLPADGVIWATDIDVVAVRFDLEDCTAGEVPCFTAFTTEIDATVVGCYFVAPLLTTHLPITLGDVAATAIFEERGNTFNLPAAADAYDYIIDDSNAAARVVLATRETQRVSVANNDLAVALPADQYGCIVLVQSLDGTLVLTGPTAPVGAWTTLVVQNESVGIVNLSFDSGTGADSWSMDLTDTAGDLGVGINQTRAFTFRSMLFDGVVRHVMVANSGVFATVPP